MRFNTPEEVKTWAARAAADDYRRHIEHGIDFNPFCTVGARNDWQRGFNNDPPRSYEGTLEFDTVYQRGRAAAKVVRDHAVAPEAGNNG